LIKTITTLAALITMSTIALAKPAPTPKPTYSTPTISCFSSTPSSITVQVQAGATGAPAGFSIQWMKTTDLQALGGVWPADGFCKASFSGVPGCSNYNLAPYSTITIQIGDNLFDACGASSENCAQIPLDCATQYSFRAFAHATSVANRSAFSATTTCTTESCTSDGGCTYTQGFWATHGPIPVGNNENLWPVTSLDLGSVTYTDLQLLSIFNTPASGNGLLTLTHQLIAAKLNIANGADPSAIQGTINAADTLIDGSVIPPNGSGFLAPGDTSTLVQALKQYNEGTTCPGHCQ
jgi:hypothetical protein